MARHVRFEAATDCRYGCAPGEREFEQHIELGVVPLDKPAGQTSRQAGEAVRRLLGASKAGHGGTLDPNVTGVLPVLLGRATKVASVLLRCDKAYEGGMHLHGDVDDGELEQGLQALRGTITQLPPVRSAVKRRERQREVYRFDVTERAGRDARFLVECERGTYVRKLVHDLGQELGCGAHMTWLRRTCAAGFGIADCVTLEQVSRACRRGTARGVVVPVERVLARLLPGVWIADGAVQPVCTGYPVAVPGIAALDDFGAGDAVAIYTLKGEAVGIGEALVGSQQLLSAERGEAVKPVGVLMERDVYPPWRSEDT